MKRYLVFLVLLLSSEIFSQGASKVSFQKNRYDLAISYYKKEELDKALDLFSVACKIHRENEVGKEAMKKITALKKRLRKDFFSKTLGNWRLDGNKPTWAVRTEEDENKTVTEVIEISETKVLFYEEDKKTKLKKWVKTEDLVFYNEEEADSLFSAIVWSNGSAWICSLNESGNILHLINIAKKDINGVEKISTNNAERFYTKVLEL
ncbi:tetratricopeptide repeat protein [Flavobacterium poyangense]|uniref:tetratricopeptide repeat protein n=1 Tax=Flavobacterium poyangense TaxID=2204302 RepID=UPI0014242452|nr:tetratricopeptide repeat protein [Flavobacterium sp. JXAS1]